MSCLLKARIRPSLTSKENDAMMNEILRQIKEYDEKHFIELDSMILYTLHSEFGFGKARLRKFFDKLRELYKEMGDKYCMPDDVPFICLTKLKDIGVDLEEWESEI